MNNNEVNQILGSQGVNEEFVNNSFPMTDVVYESSLTRDNDSINVDLCAKHNNEVLSYNHSTFNVKRDGGIIKETNTHLRNHFFSSRLSEYDIKRYLSKGEDINQIDVYGMTPLCAHCDPTTCSLLIQHGANVLYETYIYPLEENYQDSIDNRIKINLLNIHSVNERVFGVLLNMMDASHVLDFLKTTTSLLRLPGKAISLSPTKDNILRIIHFILYEYENVRRHSRDEYRKMLDCIFKKRKYILYFFNYLRSKAEFFSADLYGKRTFFACACAAYSKDILNSEDIYDIIKVVKSRSELLLDVYDEDDIPILNHLCYKMGDDDKMFKCVKVLLKHGVKASNTDKNNDNCLMKYTRNNNLEKGVLKMLIKTGASLDESDIKLIRDYFDDYKSLLALYEKKKRS